MSELATKQPTRPNREVTPRILFQEERLETLPPDFLYQEAPPERSLADINRRMTQLRKILTMTTALWAGSAALVAITWYVPGESGAV